MKEIIYPIKVGINIKRKIDYHFCFGQFSDKIANLLR
jgi:hypothetical protein